MEVVAAVRRHDSDGFGEPSGEQKRRGLVGPWTSSTTTSSAESVHRLEEVRSVGSMVAASVAGLSRVTGSRRRTAG